VVTSPVTTAPRQPPQAAQPFVAGLWPDPGPVGLRGVGLRADDKLARTGGRTA
jgi:hypothetical protein